MRYTRNYIADPLRTILTATNLRGIPYNIKLAGVNGTSGSSHGMRAHADFLEFDISTDDPKSKGVRWLDSKNYSGSGQIGWQAFGATALATGAFPVGLAPRVLSQEYETHQNRTWPGSLETEDALQQGTCQEFRSVPSELEGDGTFHFVAVDGGVMNNEPLELARRFLSGGERNSRSGRKARRAVLMIDPFPSEADLDQKYTPDRGLLSVIPQLFSSLIDQARFKMDELLLAQQESVYSRFLIAPTRSFDGGAGEANAIACGALGGFGGFLSRYFRDHDYQLGRRNCQRFLQKHFVLPENNDVVSGSEWNDGALDAEYGVTTSSGRHRPIIPIVGGIAAEIRLTANDWPRVGRQDIETINAQIKRRAVALVPRLINDIVDKRWLGWLGRSGWWLVRNLILAKIGKHIEGKLHCRGQLSYEPDL